MSQRLSSADRKSEKRAITLLEVIVALIVVAIIAAILFPVLTQRKGKGSTAGLSGVKQSAIAILMYAVDWDGRIPIADHWMDDLEPYIKNEDVFIDYEFVGSKKGNYGYAFFEPVSGIAIDSVANVDVVPLVFQSTLTDRNAHSDLSSRPKTKEGKRLYVAFLDAHAQYKPLSWPDAPIVLIIDPRLKHQEEQADDD